MSNQQQKGRGATTGHAVEACISTSMSCFCLMMGGGGQLLAACTITLSPADGAHASPFSAIVFARLSPVWPPMVGRMASGRSYSTGSTYSTSGGSTGQCVSYRQYSGGGWKTRALCNRHLSPPPNNTEHRTHNTQHTHTQHAPCPGSAPPAQGSWAQRRWRQPCQGQS